MAEKLINRRQCKTYALEISDRYKGGKFTRVSQQFLDDIEEDVRVMVYKRVMSHPSVGRTLK